jgi:hypothetical protein
MSIADSFGDGEIDRDDMTRAVATWQALLKDQETIASEPRSLHLPSRMLARWLALTRRSRAGAERFDTYDTDQSGTLDKPQVAAVLKVPLARHLTARHRHSPPRTLHRHDAHWWCTLPYRI